MRRRSTRYVARLSDRPATGPWPRAIYRGALSRTRVEVPPGDVTLEIVAARWDQVDLSGQRIANYWGEKSVVGSCNFSRCTFENGVLGHIPLVTYRSCNFERADLRNCAPQYARFEGCRFVDA